MGNLLSTYFVHYVKHFTGIIYFTQQAYEVGTIVILLMREMGFT